VNALFTEKPPLSTEQILHYDKYVDYEKPVKVTYDLGIENMELEFSTTIGEALLSEILAYNLDEYGGAGSIGFTGTFENSRLATGWGGDVFNYYSGGGAFLSVLVTTWDSENDNSFHREVLEEIFDGMGIYWEEEGVYRVGSRYVRFESGENTTTLFCSDSLDLIGEV
jgi:hypothetical protein